MTYKNKLENIKSLTFLCLLKDIAIGYHFAKSFFLSALHNVVWKVHHNTTNRSVGC